VTWSDIVSRLLITTPRSRALSTMLTVDDSTVTLMMLILSIWFMCPSHITCVLDELRHSWLELVHATTSATHPDRWSTASTASSTDVVTQTWQSSAYWCSCRPWLAMTLFKSTVYRTNRRGRGRTPVELRTGLDEWTTADHCRKPVVSGRKRTTSSSVARRLWSRSCTAVGVGAAHDWHSRMLRTGRAKRSTSFVNCPLLPKRGVSKTQSVKNLNNKLR